MRMCGLAVLGMALVCGQGVAQVQTGGRVAGERAVGPATVRDSAGKLVAIPSPDPAKPVNYVKWMNETFGGGIQDNAAKVYEEAYTLYSKTEPKEDEFDAALAGPWEGLATVTAWLKANSACLEKFRQAAMKRQCYFQLTFATAQAGSGDASAKAAADPRVADMTARVILPHLREHRTICRALIMEGWQAFKRGEEDRLIDNCLAVLRSAHHLDDQPMSIQYLVAASCASMAYDTLRKALSASSAPDALAGRCVAKLAAADPLSAVQDTRVVKLEVGVNVSDLCQRVFKPGAKPGTWEVVRSVLGQTHELSNDDGAPSSDKMANEEKELGKIGYDATLREVQSLHKQVQDYLSKPYDQASAAYQAYDGAVAQSKNPLIRLAMSSWDGWRLHAERRIAAQRATFLAVQLFVHHAKNKSFPDRLDDLKVTNLKELRIDPFSGKDFVYKKQGKSFVLYSVGKDLRDDGGKHDASWKSGDFVFWPVQEKAEQK